ncbi:MAG: hypothetical protein A2017_07845 [Lentisphaerae bacterium GWF2_44_16]|nr:MAG: hypothetical protein A2017_07845 [Lentisphaerae bacterium GWF2_44_16]
MNIQMSKRKNKKPGIAIVDLLLAYPPKGGAGVDLFNNFSRLSHKFEIKIFGIRFTEQPQNASHDFQRGIIEKTPPLDYAMIDIMPDEKRDDIVRKIHKHVSEWKPDLVFVADGWTLKPYLIKELSRTFSTIVRLYAYEMLCPRNNQKWLGDRKCANNALDDCSKCLACAREYADIVRKSRNGENNPLTFEASLADIWRGDYCRVLSETVRNSHFIVYNSITADILKKHGCLSVTRIPGAVAPDEFAPSPEKNTDGKGFHIVVCGRMDDRAKGASVAIEAGRILKAKGFDIRMTVTSQKKHDYEWLNETGWLPQTEIIKLLNSADCALVPSLWEEAFGMTWVEAMSMKVPVIAGRTGGPAEYIQDTINGLLAEPGSAEDFAEKISLLYNSYPLREKLSENGRKFVEKYFTWDISADMLEELIRKIISENGGRKNQSMD